MPEATVHIVDDDPAVRSALTRLCRSAGLAAVAHQDPTTLPITRTREASECILLDVRLAEQNGLTVQETLRDAGCTVPIIFLTGYGTIPMTVRAMRGGAVEFLTKPVGDMVLLEAIHRALEMDAATLRAGRLQDALSKRLAALTAREGDVLRCAIGGLMNKQIAAELGITEITAKVHKRRMMEKMQARSLADLVLMAHQLGIEATRQR
ncbi:response regulator [Methylobacterium sp. WL7]|jgi:FixJ family two-component response regulator|uniref:response regulator transcription factor n=1 Tax=Methylobacterium sp. WL7 TaxID=2603900 RepID=UPI0011CADD87|nr:response regulator [Methylobacterium sp. WL7]TXN44837.1 response regulator transcription factor [Methylobacterium sp. WL7]